ncbi:MAG: peptidylprolyl isomerase [Caldisericia bacterium]|nr:peptidylprolyl isomerase [Caldisericia bacterium]MDD4614690.1 peptidylprolyl isomerase [Caldisericia bacterium]
MGREQKIKQLRKEGILTSVKVDKKRKSAIRNMFIWIPSVIIIVVLVFGMWAYSAKDTSATVNGTRITNREVEELLEPIKGQMQQQGINPEDPEQSQNVEKYRSSVIEMLINKILIEHYAKEHSISITDEELEAEIEKEMDQIRSQYGSDEEFQNQLQQSTLRNEENLRKEIRRSIEPALLEDTVLAEKYKSVNVTEEEARIFFNAPSSVEAQRVFLAIDPEMDEATVKEKEDQLTDIRTKIVNNELSFEKAVTEYSEDNASKVNEGKIYLQEGSYEEEPALWEAVQTLSEGDISGIVETSIGRSIILVNKISRNRQQYDQPEHADILKIILEAPQGAIDSEISDLQTKARGYVNTIRSGKETFENIATTYSTEPEQGITPNPLYKGSNPPVDDVVFGSLQEGAVSDPISTNETTFEIIKLVKKYPAKTAVFEDFKDQIVERIENQEKNEIREAFLEELRDQSKVSHSNPWQRMTSWWDHTFGGFFESLKNWVRGFTVDPIPENLTPTDGDFQSPMTIPIQGEDGEQQSITIDPSMMEAIDVPVEGQTQTP